MNNLGKIQTNLARGLNQQASQTINQNECSVSENFVFKDRSATVREGIKVFGSLPAPVVALKKFYNKDGGNYFTAIAGGNFYNSVTSGSFTSVSMGGTISGIVDTEIYAGAVYFTDYETPVKYFDGEVVDVVGLSSPVFRKQIQDFEDVTQWTTANLNGTLQEDRHYTHIDHGKKAIMFSASSPSAAAIFSVGGGQEVITTIDANVNSNLSAPLKNICRDLSGGINVFYSVSSPYDDIYWGRSTDQGSSFTRTQVTSSVATYRKYYPSCAVDSSNNIHLVYLGTNQSYPGWDNLYYSKYTVSSWDETYLTSSHFPQVYSAPKIAVDASNNIHIVYCSLSGANNYFNKYRRRNYSGVWTSESTIMKSSPTFGGFGYAPDLAIDRSNVVHIAWNSALVTGSSINPNSLSLQNCHYVESLAGTPLTIISAAMITRPAIACDMSCNVHIVTQGNQQINYITKTGATWGSAYPLNSDPTVDALSQKFPQISIESNNKLHIFWKGTYTNSPSYAQVRYTNYLSGWATVVALTSDTENQGVIAPIWSLNPIVSSNILDRTKTGYAFAWYDGTDIKYHASYDLLWTSSQTAPMAHDLTHFASDVSSDMDDIIQVYTCHDKKQNISSLQLQFIDSDSYTASVDLCALSSWKSCSNDQWGLTHNIPKKIFTVSNSGFQWGSCNLQIQMLALSSLNVSTQVVAKCAIDNLRMIKTPPIIDYSVSTPAKSDLLFFGSSATAALRSTVPPPEPTIQVQIGSNYNQDSGVYEPIYQTITNPSYIDYLEGRWIPPAPALDTIGELQLQGLKMIADPLPSGTYYYKATFLKESPSGMEIESTPTFQSSGFVVSNAASSWTYTHLTNIPIAPDAMGVDGRRIYRRRADETTFRAVYTIGDNSVTTFLDTVPNVTLGKSLEPDHTPPPQAKIVTKASNQIVYYANIKENGIAYPSRVRYSMPYEPYYCPLSNTIDFSSDDGQGITGSFELTGVMHILKEGSTWIADGNNAKSIHTAIGCIAQNSVAVGRSEVFWLSDEGVIRYRMYQFQNVSHSVSGESIYRIQTILDRLPKESLSNACGTYYNGYYLLAVTDAGSATNNLVLCYDVDNDIWTVFPNINVNCWETWAGSQEGYRLFFGNNSGLVCEMFTGDYDISTPIYSKIRCKDFGIPTPQEQPRKAYLFMQDLDGQTKTLNATPIYDFVSNSSYPGTFPLTLSSGEHKLEKMDLQMNDPASFFSMQIEGSGRYRIQQLEIYAKQEKVR